MLEVENCLFNDHSCEKNIIWHWPDWTLAKNLRIAVSGLCKYRLFQSEEVTLNYSMDQPRTNSSWVKGRPVHKDNKCLGWPLPPVNSRLWETQKSRTKESVPSLYLCWWNNEQSIEQLCWEQAILACQAPYFRLWLSSCYHGNPILVLNGGIDPGHWIGSDLWQNAILDSRGNWTAIHEHQAEERVSDSSAPLSPEKDKEGCHPHRVLLLLCQHTRGSNWMCKWGPESPVQLTTQNCR